MRLDALTSQGAMRRALALLCIAAGLVAAPPRAAEEAWSATAPEHGIELRRAGEGLLVLSLPPASTPWSIELRLSRHGPPDRFQEAFSTAAVATDTGLELVRSGLTERWVVGARGIEHTLLLPLAGDDDIVLLDYAVAGSLTPKVSADGRAIAFSDRSGAVRLVHGELQATDGDGRDVGARWERVGPLLRLTLEVGDHGPPIVVAGRIAAPKVLPAAPDELSGVSASLLAPPGNDACQGAEPIPSAGPFPHLTAVHDITEATTTGDPPAPSCQPSVSRSIWFRFTPAASGSYTLSLCADGPTGSTVDDTVLAVYTGTGPCDGLVEVAGACDDDSCGAEDLQSVLERLDLTAGTTYSIVAWKYGAAAPAPTDATVQLRVVQNGPPPAPPPNDRCEGAEVIPGAGPFPSLTALTQDVAGATTAGDPPSPSCQVNLSRSIWYSFTPAASGRYSLSLCADAPTGTTLDDSVLAVYTDAGPCTGFTEIAGGCDDDSCGREANQSVLEGIELTAGTRYSIVVWSYGATAPAPGNGAVQLRVGQVLAPPNDGCAGEAVLSLDAPRSGTTAHGADDFRLPSGSTCFAGIGQAASTAPGPDVVYRFTAPASGAYSFRVTGFDPTQNLVLYVASACPSGPAPALVSGCLGGANRNSGYTGEEVTCLDLSAGQVVHAYVDEHGPTGGSPFTVEVERCRREAEPDDTPGAAIDLACGIEGSIGAGGDADFFRLGTAPAGSRVFALVDGVAGNSTDFDVRVTTGADTLEYDDLNDDTPFGSVAPNVAGTAATGLPTYVRVSHYSPTAAAEPYRLYATVEPPSSSAAPEVEPNDTPASATTAAGLYFWGLLSGPADVDMFSFPAQAGELVLVALDADPGRNGTPFNGSLALLDGAGAPLLSVDDASATSATGSGSGSLVATVPWSPAEALAYRIRAGGTHYAKVGFSSGAPGDYLLSIGRSCKSRDGDPLPDVTDCAPDDPATWSRPAEAERLRFPSAADRTLLQWDPPRDPGCTVLRYDLLRSTSASSFASPACVVKDTTATSASDPAVPARAFFYLVRPENACGSNLGTRSDGTPRTAGACP